MRGFYKPQLLRVAITFLIGLLFAGKAISQIDISIGTGTVGNGNTTYPCPLQDYFEGGRSQYLYRASELVAAGMGPGNIGALRWNVTALNSFSGTVEQFSIRIGTTTAATLGTTTWENITNTVVAPVNYTPVVGTNSFNFSAPFFWNGVDNLVIEICNGDPTSGNTGVTTWTGNVTIPWTTGLAFNGSHNYRDDDEGFLCGTATTDNTGTQTTRPNVTLVWTPAVACSGTPNAGTATANPSSVCLGQSFSLSVTGGTVASGLTYQWQSSPNNTTFTNIAGATGPFLTTTQTASTWYRRITTCTNGGASANSTSVQVLSPTLVSGTFTINNALPTGGTNFSSYNAAYDYIKCGINGPVVFNVAPLSGPYTEQLIMNAVPGASNVNTVTFNGNGTTLRFLSTNTNERAVIKLNNADHIRFDSLVITAQGSTTTEFGYGIQLIDNADSNIVRNCTINSTITGSASTNYGGIIMNFSAAGATTTGATQCDGNLFDNNTIIGGHYGVTMVGSSTVAVQRNRVTRNRFRDQYLQAIHLSGNFDALIEDNDITKAVATISPGISYGIFVTSLNTRVNISRNRIHDVFNAQATTANDYYGITHSSTDALATLENLVVNNAIYGIRGNGTIYGINNTGSDNIWYYHNTIALDETASTSSEATRGFFQTTSAAGIEFRNNTITLRRGGSGQKHAIYIASNTPVTDYISNNNNFFVGTGGTYFVGFSGAAGNQATLTNWQTASTEDANSISNDPLYANVATGLLRPTNASVNDLGANLSANLTVATDIDNVPRLVPTPDMGAWEFTPLPCVTPPTPGTSITSISGPVCPNTLGNFNLTGNSIGLSQTYEWQFSVNIAGPYFPIGGASSNPSFNYSVVQTGYFRCLVTCSGSSATSVPVLVNVNGALPGGTYTINSALPTAGTNFQSFNHAYQAMRCGILGPIILNVNPTSGPYNEQLIMDSVPGASAINTITFNGNGRTIAFSSTDGNERAVIKLRRADHITFDSLTINATGAGTFGYGVQLINNADSNTFRRCNIVTVKNNTSTNYTGIAVNATDAGAITTGATNCDGNTFDRNTVTGGFYGITLVAAAATPILNNRVLNNTFVDYYSYGAYISSSNRSSISGNDFSRPTNTNTTTHYGVYVQNATLGLTVANNKIHDPFTGNPSATSVFYGIYFTGVDATAAEPNRVFNNILYKINGESDQFGIYNISSDHALYYHNTLNFDDLLSQYSAADWTRGFFQTNSAVGVEFRNNIVTITRTGSGTRHGVYLASGTSGILLNHNDYHIVNGGTLGGLPYIGFNNTDQATMANWRTSTGQEANSETINPVYVNAAIGNLEPISPIIDNKGTPVGVATDIRGLARATGTGSTPDMGAFEFAILPCTVPPPASTATANPNNNICMGAMIQLRVPGISYTAGQSYQWQTATAAAGPYTNLGGSMLLPDTTVEAMGTLYYRCVLTCSGQSTPSAPALVTLNPAFLAGTYTINSTIPASATNFTSFNSAVAALYCGITGHVIFNVAPNTYTEQVRVGNVPGVGPNATVTFQAANGVASSAILTFNSTAAATNYTLRLDSARYFTFRNLTINATNATNGRAIDLAAIAANNNIRNCAINAPTVTTSSTNVVGIFSNSLRGNGENNIVGNTITGGSSGIYLVGFTANNTSPNNVIDSNTINGSYQYNLYLQLMRSVKVRANTINVTGNRATPTYGMFLTTNDSAINVSRNIINMSSLTVTNYGMHFTTNRASLANRGFINNNRVSYGAGVTGGSHGISQTNGANQQFTNNVVVVNTTSATAYGIFHNNGGAYYYNNSVNNNSPTAGTTNVAAYLSQTSATGGRSEAINNIFSHYANGRAILMSNSNFVYSDYNMLYTNGTTLGTFGTAAISNFRRWVDTSGWDYNSISYRPAFVSGTNLEPDVASPDVWAIHGRGVQLPSSNSDFNGSPRPVTLQAGVPDLGAYEFVPTSVPVALVATPAAPAPNTTQKFSLGTDTVTIIRWGASVPTTIAGKRYTGVQPPGLGATQPYMYFYTDYDVTGGSNYNYQIEQNFMDPWLGFLPNEGVIKMGRTDAANAWIISPASIVDTMSNSIRESNLSFIDKYTGLTDGLAVTPPIEPVLLDTSNRGTRFWVAYGHHQFFGSTNTQQMVLYLGGATQPANVTVRINGTPWVRNYTIPANTVITSDIITKAGLFDARILEEGKSPRGISIVSDIPIVAYAHIYGSASSGATMLLPTGTYGYDYTALTSRQNYASDCFSWFYIVAERNNTVVEITPSKLTRGGRAAGVPFTVTLNKGEVYQVLGEIESGSEGFDLTGSRAKSVPNSAGKCLPFAFFSGSSRTGIGCGASAGGSGDNIIQQNFPFQAWGRKYLTAPTSNATAANNLMTNIFKIAVKEATTITLRIGNVLQPPINVAANSLYQFETNLPTYIEANKPITVAQFMSSSGSCPNTSGNGDPEMFYLSPLEQGIKRVTLYRNTQQAITNNYLTLIVPTGGTGLSSLRIDGSNTFDFTLAHPSLAGYTIVVRRWTAAQAQTIVTSDSAFTAITYGLGSVESYGYNAGTLVKNLNAVSSISNILSGSAASSPYTCKGTPFRFNVLLTVKPTLLTWQFSQVPGLSPSTDLIQNNPTPTDSTQVDGVWFYNYTVTQSFTYNGVGTFVLPISLVHPTIESCNSSLDITVSVTVLPEPVANFTTNFSGCVGDVVQFSGTAVTNNNTAVTNWSWNFGDNTTGTGPNTTKQYTTAGTYNVELRIVSADGCLGDTIKPVVVNPRPVANVVADSLSICIGTNATFTIQNPIQGATYNWYSAATGGTLLTTGTSYTINNVTATQVAFVEAVQNGCVSVTRKRVVVTVLPLLTAPVAVLDSAGVNFLLFKWNAVPNAISYSVSTNNGATWQTPSSGPTGLTHRVTGLVPLQTATLLVRANGGCQDATSAPVTGRTLTDQLYFPNSFTPNGDGRNEVWQVYGYVIRDVRMLIYNQWGEKIFESRNQSQGWNGTYKGKKQPAGVYMYVVELTLVDGTKQLRKGEINLIL
jgi:trimeric autotransporter adhesin